jgi:hypothetical protein
MSEKNRIDFAPIPRRRRRSHSPQYLSARYMMAKREISRISSILRDAPAPLDEAAERERFERIAKARPYAWECSRSLAHEEWPGEYRLDATQSAWEFWLAAKRDERKRGGA